MRIALLGTGLMGTAVAKALLSNGYQVDVWNRTPGRARPLAEASATIHENAADAVRHADAVILLLLDHEVARQVLGTGLNLHGKDILDMITGGVSDARELATFVHEAGAHYLDIAIQCFPGAIGTDDSLIYVSGEDAIWKRQRGTLRAIATHTQYLGSVIGLTAKVDAAMSGAFSTVAYCAWTEALAFMVDAGVDPDSIVTNLEWWTRQLGSNIKHSIEELRSGDFSTEEASMKVHGAALAKWRQVLLEGGHRAGIMTAAMHNIEMTVAAGMGDQSWTAQVQMLRNNAFVSPSGIDLV